MRRCGTPIVLAGFLAVGPVGCKKKEAEPEDAPKASAPEACRAADLEAFISDVTWFSARALPGPAPAAGWTIARDDIPALHDPKVATYDYVLGPDGLTLDGHRVGSVGTDPTPLGEDLEMADKLRMGSAVASDQELDDDTWRLVVDPKTPAAHVATVLLALRERGRANGALVFATEATFPAGELDEELLRGLTTAERLSAFIDQLEATFTCDAVRDVLAKTPPGPTAADGKSLRDALPAAMETCACKPTIAAYRSLVTADQLAAAPRDRVGVAVGFTVDLRADPIEVPKGATWGEVAATIDTAEARRGWISTPEVSIPAEWSGPAIAACRRDEGERCALACELGDAVSCETAKRYAARAALTPAMRSCAEYVPGEPPPPPPPPPPTKIDETAVLATEDPPVPAPPTRGAVVFRRDRAELVRELGIGGECDAERWLAAQAADPKDESAYCVLSLVYEECDQPDEALKWAVERTRAFADHPGAWIALAIHYFAAYGSDPAMSPAETAAVGHAMVDATDHALALDPKSVLALQWAALAHDVRSQGRAYVEEPKTDAQHLEVFLCVDDVVAAWHHRALACELAEEPFCPPPPLDEAAMKAHEALAARRAAAAGK